MQKLCFWRWRSKAARAVASLAVVAALGSALVVLEAATVARLSGRTNEAPTRIYARPYVLYVGMPADRELLRAQLERLGYVATRRAEIRPGEYRLDLRTWMIGRRHFRHHERLSPGGLVTAQVDYGGWIASLEDPEGRRVSYVALEPELIGAWRPIREDRIPVCCPPCLSTCRCRARHRGSAFLRASRARLEADRCSGARQPSGRPGRAGRQHDHATTREESLPQPQPHDTPKGP